MGQVLIFTSPGHCMLLINNAIEIYRATDELVNPRSMQGMSPWNTELEPQQVIDLTLDLAL